MIRLRDYEIFSLEQLARIDDFKLLVVATDLRSLLSEYS